MSEQNPIAPYPRQFETSESIGALAAALSKFQGEAQDAHKDSEGNRGNYAGLPAVLTTIRPLLAKNELAITQMPYNIQASDCDRVGIATMLMHSSGEWVRSTFDIRADPMPGINAPQVAGLILTYLRRYAAASFAGIASSADMDADNPPAIEPASPKQIEEIKARLEYMTTARKNWLANVDYAIGADMADKIIKEYPLLITADQHDEIVVLLEEYGVDKGVFLTAMGVKSIGAIPRDKFNQAKNALKRAAPKTMAEPEGPDTRTEAVKGAK